MIGVVGTSFVVHSRSMTKPTLLVTHHSPDLDAVTSVWLFKRFDAQTYSLAKVAFVNPGSQLSPSEAAEFGVPPHEVIHVDTGLGEFDHHQADRGLQYLSAAKLVYHHLITLHPDIAKDEALGQLVAFVTDVDQFAEIEWPEADSPRYCLMIQELIRGLERQPDNNDLSQLEFGMKMLDAGYAALSEQIEAKHEIDTKAHIYALKQGSGVSIETSNDATIKLAQKQGHQLVVKKDPKLGNIRVKLRPDAQFDLKPLQEKIIQLDKVGSWYYHPSGRMLLNGSDKHRDQKASPLTLEQVTTLVKEMYG
jgi:hypothetical protein